jgi:hypothetical protein
LGHNALTSLVIEAVRKTDSILLITQEQRGFSLFLIRDSGVLEFPQKSKPTRVGVVDLVPPGHVFGEVFLVLTLSESL